MDARKKKHVEDAGWRIGTAAEFLQLSEAESALVEMRFSLARSLRVQRTERGATQTSLAKALRSSQSRVAKMESGDPSVSLDLIVRALLLVGATRRDVASAIIGHVAQAGRAPASQRPLDG